MNGSLSLYFAWINGYPLVTIMFVFLSLLCGLLASTLIFTLYKRRIDKIKKSWENEIAVLIMKAILYTEDDGDLKNIWSKSESLLQNNRFRQEVINEILLARKEVSGVSAANLKVVYETLGFNHDSYRKLKNKKWHIKAKGAQELAIMEQKKYVKEIFRFTNHHNMYVRNEAQCALVNFYGFLGLRFLNVTVHQISEWQQIQLLNKLNGVTPKNFEMLKKWLNSSNDSVVVFALKLCTFYHRYELYENVIACLLKTYVDVKLNVLTYMRNHFREDTASLLIDDYGFDNKTYQLAIIDTIAEIATEDQIPFLLKQLHHKDDDIKTAAAKALSMIHPSGSSFLQTHLFANENPWKSIFLQIQNDRAA